MKPFSFILIFVLIPSLAFGAYTVTIDKDLDYYRTLAESGVTVPMAYQATPTAETLRDALIAAGLMEAAPIIITYSDLVHEDRPNIAHADRAGIVHEDHLQ